MKDSYSYQQNRQDENTRSSKHSWHPYRSNNNNKWPKKNQEDKDHQADDQIAPKYASRSVRDLQQWALATAKFPQHGHGKRENEIIERIQRRYANASQGGYENPYVKEVEEVQSEAPVALQVPSSSRVTEKRQRSASPSYNNQTKKRRPKSPSHQKLEQNDDGDGYDYDYEYAQSSDWSFPESEDEK